MNHTTSMTTVRPATRWEDALPLGNGSLGALVYGSICSETIVVNEETMWCDTEKPDVPDVNDCLGDFRKLLKGEKWAEASGLMAKRMSDRGYQAPRTDPYHPVCDLRIVSKPEAPFSDYRRALDFATGIATISWTAGDCRYRRECFVSRADDLIALRYTCTAPRIHCAINLQPRGTIEENSAFTSHQIDPLQSVVSTQHRDSLTSGLHIRGADEVLVFIKVYGPRPKDNTLEAIRTKLQDMAESYDSLLSRHVDLHSAGYSRLKLDLGSTDADKDNEPLLLGSYNGDVSTALVEKMFNFGRYLLFTSSRPGGWPANLQGLWNGDYMPAWSSDYHNDENIQMNYWPALPGNLSETLAAYVDYYEASVPDYQKNAQALYGCRGILAPIAQDIKGRPAPPAGGWASWTAGAGEGDNRILMRNRPDEIRAMVESMVETAKMSGGYAMCIGNHIPFNVPPEAVKLYFDLSAELGYR
jgi:alpha-L-fucosidase 2